MDCFGTCFTHVQTASKDNAKEMNSRLKTYVFAYMFRRNADNVWYETGKLCKWREKRERLSLLSRKWSFRYGKTLISFQSLAFFNISVSTYFSASTENTVRLTKSRIKGQEKTWKGAGPLRHPWPCCLLFLWRITLLKGIFTGLRLPWVGHLTPCHVLSATGLRSTPWGILNPGSNTTSSWWFHPLWKICSSKWEPSPNRGENKKKIETTTQYI